MKKILLAIVMALFLMVGSVNAFVVEVGFDESLDFSLIEGFAFHIDGLDADGKAALNLQKREAIPDIGAGPTYPWDVFMTTDGAMGFDYSYGTFPLQPGIALSLTGDDPFSLSTFTLSYSDDPLGNYPLPFMVTEKNITEGLNYTYSNVPIPSSLLLLGGGIFAVAGISRRKK